MTTEFLTLPATFEVAMNGIVIRTTLMDQLITENPFAKQMEKKAKQTKHPK